MHSFSSVFAWLFVGLSRFQVIDSLLCICLWSIICSYVDNMNYTLFLIILGVAFTFMVFSLFFFGASQSGIACAYLDTSPNYSSILNTIGNTFGAVAGLCGPLVVSLFTSVLNGAWGWRCVFFLTLVQSIISVVVFSMYYVSTPVNILNTPTSRYNRI